jgi:very-short-patch-repair endonuclease
MKTKDLFTAIIKSDLNVEAVTELRFHPSRQWRFDYAIPELKIAIEIEGGVWTRGRHNRGTGFIKDMEKYNAAASLGWLLLRFTPDMKLKSDTLRIIGRTIKQRRAEMAARKEAEKGRV